MTKGRLEAFSDGVIAIIITIMVLEIKVPEATGWADLALLWPKFVSYILSFMYVGIYWNNHHHTFQAVKKGVGGKLLWANLNLLFWLSLLPFATGWMGEHEFSRNPIIFYGFILVMCAASYTIMLDLLKKREGEASVIAKAVGGDRKGKLSVFIYLLGIGLAFVHPVLGFLMYAIVALIWLIPDTRIEKIYMGEDQSEP